MKKSFVIGIAFLSFALPAHAVEDAPLLDETGARYWMQSYQIPTYYSLLAISFESKNPEGSLKKWRERLGKIGAVQRRLRPYGVGRNGRNGLFPMPTQTFWDVPTTSTASLSAAAHADPELTYYHASEPQWSPAGELSKKKSLLLAEMAASPALMASDPIRLLVEEELRTLNIYLKVDGAARRATGLLLSISPPGQAPTFQDFPSDQLHIVPDGIYLRTSADFMIGVEISLSTDASRFAPHYWARTAPSVPAAQAGAATIEVKDPERLEKRLTKLQAIFDIHTPPFQKPFRQPDGWRVPITIPSGRAKDFRKALQKMGELTFWNLTDAQREAYATASEKYAALQKEAQSRRIALDASPATRGLVDAEIRRLRDLDEQHRASKTKIDFNVLAKSPPDPPPTHGRRIENR